MTQSTCKNRPPEVLPALWLINDEEDALCLQIELGNDHAVTLTIMDGEPRPKGTRR